MSTLGCRVRPPLVCEVGGTYADMQARLEVSALALLEQALRRGRRSPEAWRDAVQSIGQRLLLIQVATAALADPFLNDVLEAQDADTTSEGAVAPEAFADLGE